MSGETTMPRTPSNLPIEVIRAELAEAVRTCRKFVLEAPTGSGKSTQVPQMLLDDGLVGSGMIVVLQPRRLPARVLAKRVARERGTVPGDEVGWQVRLERVAGPRTRILYVTEGILTRWLLADPELCGVGAVLLDEFHERHLHGDVALAQVRELQRTRRPELVLGVLSATLDAGAVADYLAPCPRLRTEGRTFPVAIRYAGSGHVDEPMWDRAAQAVAELVERDPEGDVLVFMPGAAEIHRTLRRLEELPATRRCRCVALHGELPPDLQDAALEPGPQRRIIVATNVAETSLTIEGVRLVVDAGYARMPEYDPVRGINTLLVEKISRASADQRAGRAGRTAPGVCVRLWTERDHAHRAAFTAPEIKRLELTETVLALRLAGVEDVATFPWLEAPEERALEQAEVLLHDLGAVDAAGRVTARGRALAALPVHPRLGRLVLAGAEAGVLEEAALAAAVASGRALRRQAEGGRDAAELERMRDDEHDASRCDFLWAVRLYEAARARKFDPDWGRRAGVHAMAAREAGEVAAQLRRAVQEAGLATGGRAPAAEVGPRLRRAVLAAFSDHLARRRDAGTLRCALVGGRSGELRRESGVRDDPLLVATELEERTVRGDVVLLLGMATAVDEAWLAEDFPGDLVTVECTALDPIQKRVIIRRERRFRDLVLEVRDGGPAPAGEEAARLLADEALAGRLELRHWNAAVDTWIRRLNLVARACPEYGFPTFGEEERRLVIEQLCLGATSFREVRERDVWPELRGLLVAGQEAALDELAPERYALPSGFRARIDYRADGTAVLAARVQQLYDCDRHPAIAGGRVPLVVEILAPNHRPVQVTTDLPGFWQSSYLEVRKQLKGRYPRHEWR